MRKRFILLVLLSLICAACAVETEPAAAGIPPTLTAHSAASITPAAYAAASPTPPASPSATTESTPTATPTPQAAFTSTPPIATTAAPANTEPAAAAAADAARLNLTHIRMFTETGGWATAFLPDGGAFLLHTADGGRTWRDVTPAIVSKLPFNTAFLDENTAWVNNENDTTGQTGGSANLARTTDGGSTWEVINKSLPQEFLNLSAGMTFRNRKEGWTEIYGVGAGQAHIQVYSTQDGGASWNQVMLGSPPDMDTTGEPPGTLHLCNICGDSFYYDPIRQLITYGELANDPAGKVRVSISFDQGKTWKDFNLPFPSAKFAGYSVAPQEPVFFSQKEGVLPVGLVKFNPDFTHTNDVLAIYTTQDGGLSWTPNPTVLEHASSVMFHTAIDFVSRQDAFAACGPDLCVTDDGGQTWQAVHSNLTFTSSGASQTSVWQFEFISTAVGWAIDSDGTTYSLWKTSDRGRTWQQVNVKILP